MTTNAITRREQPADRAVLTKEGLAESKQQLELLEQYVRTVLREDEDYGVIPGTGGKPTLFKPGAANVAAAFNCHAETTINQAVLDPKAGFVAYQIKVDLVSNLDGVIRSSGVGSCNSYEKKYRYRNASPLCPSCGKENIRKSNKGDGYYCWKKTDGCGATFDNGDQRIESQAIGRVENEDPLELANTILKMATKRAEVDAAMRLPGVARFFTQDLEDMRAPAAESAPEALAPAPTQNTRPAPTAPTARPGAAQRTPAPQPSASAELFPGHTVEGECPIHHVAWVPSKDKTDYLHRHGTMDGRPVWCVRSKIQTAPRVVESTSQIIETAKALGFTETEPEPDEAEA